MVIFPIVQRFLILGADIIIVPSFLHLFSFLRICDEVSPHLPTVFYTLINTLINTLQHC